MRCRVPDGFQAQCLREPVGGKPAVQVKARSRYRAAVLLAGRVLYGVYASMEGGQRPTSKQPDDQPRDRSVALFCGLEDDSLNGFLGQAPCTCCSDSTGTVLRLHATHVVLHTHSIPLSSVPATYSATVAPHYWRSVLY